MGPPYQPGGPLKLAGSVLVPPGARLGASGGIQNPIQLVRHPTPQARKLDQPGKNPARNTSKSAPVVKKSSFGIGFYPRGFV